MAARRAAAKAAAAAAAEPPPPPAEPAPEPEPEPKDPEPAEKLPTAEDNASKSKSKDSMHKEGKVTERIIERIIICPGGQNPYMPAPTMPPLPYPLQGQGQGQGGCHCNPTSGKKKRKVKKKGAEEELCNHPYCIVQRAKVRPQGLPWASGMWPGPNPSPKPPVVICQRPVLCCCRRCSQDSGSSDDSDTEDEDCPKTDTETYMTFMNMVFAAANVMNERPDVF